MSRPPDMILKVMDKEKDLKSNRIGCAWVNGDGSLTLQMDWPNVVTGENKNLVYTLFPVITDGAQAAQAKQKKSS